MSIEEVKRETEAEESNSEEDEIIEIPEEVDKFLD
jgi:hypothetical protein